VTVDGLPPGDWAEWFGAGAAALAFGATSLAIWQGHRLRRVEHAEAMWDDALKVTVKPAQGGKDVPERKLDGTTVMTRLPMVNVNIYNGSRRQITNVLVRFFAPDGSIVGEGTADFIQADDGVVFSFDPVDGALVPTGVAGIAMFSFEDIDETRWERHSSGQLRRFRRLRVTRRDGRRHSENPRSRP
jgi:hypothetical protein